MWASSEAEYDDGSGFRQSYGVHPFILVQAGKRRNEFVGVWFRNSNAQSPILAYNDDGSATLRYITTGGKLHAYFFMQGTATQIVSMFLDVIGRPKLPPFWALGWHASSTAYTDLEKTQANIDAYAAKKIPLDGIWLDTPYMQPGKDFTVWTKFFGGLDKSVSQWHENGQKVVPVLKSSLTDDPLSAYIQMVNDAQAAISEPGEEFNPLKQKIYTDNEIFLDLFNEQAVEIWAKGLGDLYETQKLAFDGVWLDKNEPMGVCNGNTSDLGVACSGFIPHPLNQDLSQTTDSWYTSYSSENQSTFYLPFIPSNQWNFDNMTLSLNATHFASNFTQYDTHSLFGHMQSKATFEVL